MRSSIRLPVGILLLFFACFGPSAAFASHIVGGEFTYRYLGDTLIAGVTKQKYEVTLELYQDCVTGVPDAIVQDNPAFFTVYETGSNTFIRYDTNIFFDPASSVSIGTADTLSTPCGSIVPTNLPPLCLQKKRFNKTYYLNPNSTGYIVVYQRCCRNASILNVFDPGKQGLTLYCTIPPMAVHNNSATFNDYPPQVICLNQPAVFDHAATDADGDSLTYELCAAYQGTDGLDIKPKKATAPPYGSVPYFQHYSYTNPVPGDVPLLIDTITGKLTIIPNKIGRYLIGVLCNEWRSGVLINTTRREFEWVVIDCGGLVDAFKPYAGKNQTILVGEKIQFKATGAHSYRWHPTDFLNNSYIGDPIGTFTQQGTFTYVLFGVTNIGCNGTDTVTITVLEHSDYTAPNAFTPNGDGINDRLLPIAIGNSTLKAFRVYNRWGNMIHQDYAGSPGWNGTYNGKDQDPGVYAWAIEYIDNFGTTRVKGGTTILLR